MSLSGCISVINKLCVRKLLGVPFSFENIQMYKSHVFALLSQSQIHCLDKTALASAHQGNKTICEQGFCIKKFNKNFSDILSSICFDCFIVITN